MFQIHLISHPAFFEGEGAVITDLLQHSEVYFHLRKPEATESDCLNLIDQIPSIYHSRIFLHSAYILQQKNAFAGLHFSTSKRELVCNFYKHSLISTSCHALVEVKNLGVGYNQCFLSPIFPSISKKGYSGNLDLKEISKFLKTERKLKVIALGGIEASNICKIQKCGFDGAAVLGTVWGDDPHADDDFSGRVAQLVNNLEVSSRSI